MKTAQLRALFAFVLALVVGAALVAGIARVPKASEPKAVTYEGLPAALFPARQSDLLGAVFAGDVPAQRAHAWRLWAALNAVSGSSAYGRRLPVWQTWYSSTEVYDGNPKQTRHAFNCCTFRLPAQNAIQHQRVDRDQPASTMAFVKLNRPAAQFVLQKGYDKQTTLERINAQYDAQRMPVTMRQIQPFPRESVAIKVTFWLIRGEGLTPLPYWDPSYAPPPRGSTPNHLTWRRCVAVDADNRFPDGHEAAVNCNGSLQQAPVVHLSRFYNYRLTDPADVAAVARFAKHLSMHTDQEHVVTGPFAPQIGDYLVLTAMHVTTKEIPNWTFQTFWWTPFPHAKPFGADRPPVVAAPFDNYDMCNAYSVETPVTASGGPHVCFNPYLEADLGPTKPYEMNGKRMPADPMAGTRSNCMACHSRAAWPAKMDPPYVARTSNMGGVANPGYVPRNNSYYQGITTTDFLWSIPLESRPSRRRR